MIYYIADAIHYISVEDGILSRYTKTSLTGVRNTPDTVGAVWVDLTNDADYHLTGVTKTRSG